MPDPLTPERLADIDNVLNRIGLCYSDPDWRLPWSISVLHDLRAEVERLKLELAATNTVEGLVRSAVQTGRPQHVKYLCPKCDLEAGFTLTHLCFAPESPPIPGWNG